MAILDPYLFPSSRRPPRGSFGQPVFLMFITVGVFLPLALLAKLRAACNHKRSLFFRWRVRTQAHRVGGGDSGPWARSFGNRCFLDRLRFATRIFKWGPSKRNAGFRGLKHAAAASRNGGLEALTVMTWAPLIPLFSLNKQTSRTWDPGPFPPHEGIILPKGRPNEFLYNRSSLIRLMSLPMGKVLRSYCFV